MKKETGYVVGWRKVDKEDYLFAMERSPIKDRIEHYSENFLTLKSTYEFVEKHGERVKWQIMRIY